MPRAGPHIISMRPSGIGEAAADVTRLFVCASACAGVGIVVCLVAVAVYRLFLHPLAKIPGPRAAALSNLWYARRVRDGRVRVLATTLHRQYGDAVRVGPDEVWFSTPEAFDKIYGQSHTLRWLRLLEPVAPADPSARLWKRL